MKEGRLRRLACAALIAALAACSGNGRARDEVSLDATEPTVLGSTTIAEPTTTESPSTTDTPPALSGTLTVRGSSTVEPVHRAVADQYATRQPDVTIDIDAVGTGDGFDALCGDPSVAVIGASRPIRGEESAICLANGVRPLELRLGRDGIAVIANPAFGTLECLTYPDLYALTGPESTGLVDGTLVGAFARELGSSTEWPASPVAVIAPGDVHGTHQLFVDLVIAPIAARRSVGDFLRVDHRSLDSNQELVDAVASTPGGIGVVGSSYATENTALIRIIGVSDGDGCVLPNDAAVTAGIYPLSRDLYLYVDGSSDDPIVADFVWFYLNVAVRDAVLQAGYVPLSATESAQTASRWDRR